MQSFKTVPIPAGFSDASAISAYSAVKLEDIVISPKNSTVSQDVYDSRELEALPESATAVIRP